MLIALESSADKGLFFLCKGGARVEPDSDGSSKYKYGGCSEPNSSMRYKY